VKINIVTVTSGWILQKIAERVQRGNDREDVAIRVSAAADPSADVNYYVDLQNCFYGQKTKCDIAYFTHAHENSPEWALSLLQSRKAFENLEGIVSMNKRYTDMLTDLGFPKEKLTTIVPGETGATFPMKKIKIGIVSRGGYEGYGQFFMENLFKTHKLENFEFYFLGDGWQDGIWPIAQKNKIGVGFYSDVDYDIYPDFYRQIDYLLIPGLWTAGPMSMQEALSSGIPVIGADVGFVNYEFKADYVFPPNDVEALHKIFKQIESPPLQRRRQVENMSWKNYATQLITFIEKIHQ